MQSQAKHRSDEAEVAAVLDVYAAAIRAKDARATVALYARDVVAYDLAPPLRMHQRPSAIRSTSSSGSTPGTAPSGPRRAIWRSSSAATSRMRSGCGT